MPWMIRICATVGAVILLVSILAPWVAPFDPDAQRLLARLRPPIGFDRYVDGYFLGTDELGRDVLSRSIHGMRLTLGIAVIGMMISLTIGVSLGLLSGLAGGMVDAVVMAIVDVQISVPFTLIALLIIAIAGTDLVVLLVVVGIAYWEQYARLVRGQVLAVKEMPFVEACRAMGASRLRIAFRHVLRNIASPVIVQLTLTLSNLVLLESSLSFLGLGVQPPSSSLGSMVGFGRDYMVSASWIALTPALLILTVALVVLLLGDWTRDVLDVKIN